MNALKTTKIAFLALLGLAMATSMGVFSFHKARADEHSSIAMAIEFTSHAAAAYVAQDKGWYRDKGLKLTSHSSYVTGMALASALARRDIQVAYMCLVPAINAYANARVPIRIVAGMHKHGYSLVVNPSLVSTPKDLSKEGVRLGCAREGGALDVLMHRTLERYGLDSKKILGTVRRMNPPKLLFALRAGQLDAAFLPEHWASMAEDHGFKALLTAQDIWPGVQGSVLVVKEELIRDNPEMVRTLVEVNETATRWVVEHPLEAAGTLARLLSVRTERAVASDLPPLESNLELTTETMLRSMSKMDFTTELSLRDIQEVIDYLAELGYIQQSFPAQNIVDTRFMR